MPAFKNVISTDTLADGVLRTFEFKRIQPEHKQWDDIAQDWLTIPETIALETIVFKFTTDQIESLRIKPDGSNRTDAQIYTILTDLCIENLKGVE